MREGYCPHGKYVGGCGADLMCGWCESDTEPPTLAVFFLVKRGDTWTEVGRPSMFYTFAQVHAFIDEEVSMPTYGVTHALAVEGSPS